MNVVGKILVILNLLVALVVAFFIVIVNRTSTNWKAYAEQREREIKSLSISLDTSKETLALERKEKSLLENKLKTGGKMSIEEIDKLNGAKVKAEIDRDIAKQEAVEAALKVAQVEGEKKLYIDQAADLRKTMGGREAVINKQQAEYRELKRKETELRELADRLQLRAESLQDAYRQAQKKVEELLAQGTSGGGTTPIAGAKKPSDPNPPSKMVRGKIDKIHADDRTLVQIDVGLDQGVDKNHTLEVIRLGTEPQYIGMIRIIDADFHSARGRLIRSQFAPGKAVREGDQVVSSLEMVK